MKNIDELCIDTLRVVGNEAINKANSGHPGMVMGSACIAYNLFTNHLNITHKDSNWFARDRFVLASGHASMLLYLLLHLSKFNISIDDIKNFRQLNSITPGHPEVKITDGVDIASGPLGQGIAHAVGFAMSEKFMAEQFNKPDLEIFNNYTYCLCGDGDLEEGVSQEAISLAGHLKLNKLIVIYDNNDVTLDGSLNISNSDNTALRFKASNWDVIEIDGFNADQVNKALKKAKKSLDKPTVIIAHTIIGYPSTKQGTNATHGSPLKDDLNHVKEVLNWNYAPFEIPQEVYDRFNETIVKRGEKAYKAHKKVLDEYRMSYPLDYKDLVDALNGDSTKDLDYPVFENGFKEATRATSGRLLNHLVPQIRTLIGGAADVAGSVNTTLKDQPKFILEEKGRNVFFGIREFCMSCIQSAMLLYGGIRPYIGCFFVFSDYCRPSIRTAALMDLPSINIFTHDSIAVGEDGPTHQPVEQLSSLRLIPNTYTIRPANANEVSKAYRFAMENKEGPVSLVLTRQALEVKYDVNYEDFVKGAFIVKDYDEFDYVILASGSEVNLALSVSDELDKEGLKIRVVSMPCFELFDKQDDSYKHLVLGDCRCKVIGLEMGATALLYKYAKVVFGIDEFGRSGKDVDILDYFGFTKEKLCAKIKESIK